jgi:hypothetical protein
MPIRAAVRTDRRLFCIARRRLAAPSFEFLSTLRARLGAAFRQKAVRGFAPADHISGRIELAATIGTGDRRLPGCGIAGRAAPSPAASRNGDAVDDGRSGQHQRIRIMPRTLNCESAGRVWQSRRRRETAFRTGRPLKPPAAQHRGARSPDKRVGRVPLSRNPDRGSALMVRGGRPCDTATISEIAPSWGAALP